MLSSQPLVSKKENEMFTKNLKRIVLAILVALIMTATISNLVSAATYYISEQGARFIQGSIPIENLSPCSSYGLSSCQDNNVKRGYLTRAQLGKWLASASGTTRRRMDWYAYIPNSSATFGAVYYYVSDGSATPEVFSVPVNQNTWKGGTVYLGYLSLGYNKSFMWVNTNNCVPGTFVKDTCQSITTWLDLLTKFV